MLQYFILLFDMSLSLLFYSIFFLRERERERMSETLITFETAYAKTNIPVWDTVKR